MSLFKRLYRVITSQLAEKGELGKNFESNHTRYQDTYDPPSKNSAMENTENRYRANLEVDAEADFSTIKANYRRLLKKYHPDLHANDAEKQKIAEQISRQLNEAMNYFEKKYGER